MAKRVVFSILVGVVSVLALGRCQRELPHGPAEEASSGWVSSGGEVFDDKNNPWFLYNVPEVRYCLAVDGKTMSIPRERIVPLVEKAFGYWAKEFALFQTTAGRETHLLPAVASQKFTAVKCDGTEDLRFQFGYGTLSAAQKSYLAHQNQYLSLAVRTGYDRKTLRGRGFVYVASDLGEERQPKGPMFVERPWEKEGLLLRVLLHELGHVFGLPHVGDGLMAAPYPETILRNGIWERFRGGELPDSFFTAQQSYTNCAMKPETHAFAMKWLGMPETDGCLHLRSTRESNGTVVFLSSANAETAPREVGRAVVTGDAAGTLVEIGRAGVLYLPAEQEVFTTPEEKAQKYHATSVFLSLGLTMDYTAGSTAPKPIQLRLQPNGYELVGLEEGKIRTLLTYRRGCQSVLSLLLCFEI